MTTRAFWPDTTEGPWLVSLEWRLLGGRYECVGVTVEQDLPADETPLVVTSQFLHSVPWGQLMQGARQQHAHELRVLGEVLEEQGEAEEAMDAREGAEGFGAIPKGKGGRPVVYDIRHYSRVARVYYEAWTRGEPPIQAIQRHPDLGPVAYSTAARWVRECRRRGLLGKAPRRGMPGGLPRWVDHERKGDES